MRAERVLFENIDFIPDQRAAGDEPSPALVRLLAAECEFIGCSFQSADGSPELCAGIVWQQTSAGRLEKMALPSGRIRVKNCVFRRVDAGIDSRVHGAVALDIANSLHLGPGPMIRLSHVPTAEEPLHIRLAQVTLRAAAAAVDCRCGEMPDPAGEISVEASDCVLAPVAQSALFILASEVSPRPLWRELQWTGQGSVVAGQVNIGRWRRRDGGRETLDDASISFAGLVRGTVEFARSFDGDPASSRVVNCQAPLRESESAGAETRNLPPEIRATMHPKE